jgi:hypothetical protein
LTAITAIIDYFSSAAGFVHLAVLCYVLGLLTREKLMLRSFLLLGSYFSMLYYYIADSPLWEEIAASILIATANLPVIFRICGNVLPLGCRWLYAGTKHSRRRAWSGQFSE